LRLCAFALKRSFEIKQQKKRGCRFDNRVSFLQNHHLPLTCASNLR
jgi:hypothetical protein